MHVKTNFGFSGRIMLGWLMAQFGLGLLCRATAQPGATTPLSSVSQSPTNYLRPPVHPRRNVEDFPAVMAKFVRFWVFKTNVREPCLDELEIYPVGEPGRNVALSSAGAQATASSSLTGYAIHQVQWVNDGFYGNAHSWIAGSSSNVWVQIELPQQMLINRIVWSRDREGYLIDRLATDYRIEVSTNGADWLTVATAADRKPLPAGKTFAGYGPGFRQSVIRFAPIGTTPSPEDPSFSSEYCVDRWQTEDGLPGNEVTSLLQTHDGYLWVGSSAGLARFDGVKFTRFGEQNGLKKSGILCLLEDRQDRFWVGTDGGGLFQFRDGQFEALTSHDGLFSDVVMSLAQGADGRIWIGTYDGLNCWRDGQFLQDASVPPRRNEPVSRVLDDASGLWLVLNGYLHQVKGQAYLRENLGAEPSSQIAIAALRRGPSGRLWFGGISGNLTYSSNGVMTILPQPERLSSDTILDVCEARNGDTWMGMASTGLRRWRNGRVLSLSVSEGLAENSVRCLLEDREGNIWVGTSGGGLNRLKPKKLRLVTTRDGLSHNGIMSLTQDSDGKVWIGSNGGGLSVAGGDVFAPAEISYLLDNESLPSLLSARDGTLWLGTWNSGLFRKAGAKLEQFHLAAPDNDQPVLALCENPAGGLWVGTYQEGLKLFKNGIFTQCQTTNRFTAKYITALAEDGQRRLWIGTGGEGLYCLDGKCVRGLTREDGLASDFVRTLYLDPDGVLWIGTSGGLSRLKDSHVASLTMQHGLWDDVISQILEDGSGHLWFGSNRGVFRVAKSELDDVIGGRLLTLNSLVFGKGEGMENLECTGGFCPAGLRTRDGRLWFSTVKGLAIVDPQNIPINRMAPAVMLEEVWVDGAQKDFEPKAQSRQPKAATNLPSHLIVGPGMRRVEFHYTALSFTAPERVRFRYRLDGLDLDWVEAGGRRVAEYSQLSPGQYRFHVTACNEDGVWCQSEAGLAFICLPSVWQTVWFRMLVALTALGSAGWVAKILATGRLRRRLALLQHQNALEQERTRIARDIHDELGALLTEISLLGDHSQKRLGRAGEVEINLRRICSTAREAVQVADGIVWAVNPRNDSVLHLANYLVHFVEDFFRSTPIHCRLDVPAELPQFPLSTQHRHHVLLVVKEACNNVVRHSEASEVWFRMAVADQQISIIVEDNGRGFSPGSVPEGGDGLSNMRQRMTFLGGHLELSSGAGLGTSVKLIAPLNQLNQPPCPSV
jgi:ligand-binding sensor domain-containing protein/signal transduction histidine kinase